LDGVKTSSHEASSTEAEMAQVHCAAVTISVQRGVWSDPQVAAMIAPPVTVSSMPFERPMNPWRRGQLARSRANMPVGRHRHPTR
jgi:hypothetical protein